jgi:hypothetical protein
VRSLRIVFSQGIKNNKSPFKDPAQLSKQIFGHLPVLSVSVLAL